MIKIIKRVCYECRKQMSLKEAIRGQKILDKANEVDDDFAGWIHCTGPEEVFVQPYDKEMLKVNKDWENGIQVCPRCVREVFRAEMGRPLKAK